MEIRDEFDARVISRAEDLLGTDYGMNITDDDFKGFVDRENVLDLIDDLCSQIDTLQEQLDDQKEYYETMIRECYKPISPYEFYGVSEYES